MSLLTDYLRTRYNVVLTPQIIQTLELAFSLCQVSEVQFLARLETALSVSTQSVSAKNAQSWLAEQGIKE